MTDRMVAKCAECGERIQFEDEIWIDPETGREDMEGKPFHEECAPTVKGQVRGKTTVENLQRTARIVVARIGLDWKVREGQLESGIPSVVIVARDGRSCEVGIDGQWTVKGQTSSDSPEELEARRETAWREALIEALIGLFQVQIGYLVRDESTGR